MTVLDMMNWVFEYHILELLCLALFLSGSLLVLTLIHPRELVQMGFLGRLVAWFFFGKTRKDYKREDDDLVE